MGFNDGQARVILSALADSGGQAEKAAEIAAANSPQGAQFLRNLVGGVTENPTPGALYKVDLPDEQIAKMLDWDKPLSQQPEAVRKAMYDVAGSGRWMNQGGTRKFIEPPPAWMTGGSSYARVGRLLDRGDAAASDALRQAGIPGIRYLDGDSRGTGAGTSNFVVFPGNEELLTILERNGQIINELRKKK
jgi:hypothetical protein